MDNRFVDDEVDALGRPVLGRQLSVLATGEAISPVRVYRTDIIGPTLRPGTLRTAAFVLALKRIEAHYMLDGCSH